jgi:CRP-like cAMP-binding protein
MIEITSVPLFHGLQRRHLAAVRRHGVLLDLSRGSVIFSRGQKARQFIVLLAGEVYVRRDHVTVACGPGSHFGAPELLGKRPCDATVWTESAARALVFDPRGLVGMLDEVPAVGRRLMGELVKHVPVNTSLFCVDAVPADVAPAVLAG